jgi:hypothetical protein
MTTLSKIVSRLASVSVPHGVKPEIVITLYPGGTIGLRESGRRKATEVYIDAGTLYVRCLANRVTGARLAKAKAKAEERKLRKRLR